MGLRGSFSSRHLARSRDLVLALPGGSPFPASAASPGKAHPDLGLWDRHQISGFRAPPCPGLKAAFGPCPRAGPASHYDHTSQTSVKDRNTRVHVKM